MSGAATVTMHPTGVDPAAALTLQDTYDNSGVAQPKIEVTAANGPMTLRDALASIGDVFVIEDNAGVDFFNVAETQFQWGLTGQRLFDASNVAASYGGFTAYPDDYTRTVTGQSFFQWSSTITSSVPGGGGVGNETAPNFVSWQGEVVLTQQGNLFNTQSLFNQGTVVTCDGANTGPIYTMINQPNFRTSAAGGARTGSQQNAVRSQLRMGPNLAGTFTLTSHETYFATVIMDAGGGAVGVTTVNYFAPKAPSGMGGGATIGTLNCIDLPNIPSTGITTLRGINSAMNSGQFINHTGTASAEFTNSAFRMRFDDNAGIEMGTGNDVNISWNGSALDLLFAQNSDALFINNPNNGQILLDVGANEFAFNTTRGVQFGATGTLGNAIYNFTTNAFTVTVAGGFAQALMTQSGNLNLGVLAMSDVSAWVVNSPSFDNSAYSISELATLRVGGMTTSNPGGTVTERAALWVRGRHMQEGSWQVEPITPAALNSGDNDDWAGLLTGSPNNNTRYWARISGNATTSVLTGIDATAVQDGDTFELTNVSANAIDISDQDAASAAANRIITPSGVTYILAADETVVIRYDLTTARWRLLAGTGA